EADIQMLVRLQLGVTRVVVADVPAVGLVGLEGELAAVPVTRAMVVVITLVEFRVGLVRDAIGLVVDISRFDILDSGFVLVVGNRADERKRLVCRIAETKADAACELEIFYWRVALVLVAIAKLRVEQVVLVLGQLLGFDVDGSTERFGVLLG